MELTNSDKRLVFIFKYFPLTKRRYGNVNIIDLFNSNKHIIIKRCIAIKIHKKPSRFMTIVMPKSALTTLLIKKRRILI